MGNHINREIEGMTKITLMRLEEKNPEDNGQIYLEEEKNLGDDQLLCEETRYPQRRDA